PAPPPEAATASPAMPAAPAVPAAPELAQNSPAATSSDPLVLTAARGECWVTVSDAGGKVLLQRLLAAGETVNLSGALPMRVVLGRAANIDARVHGQAFDLAPLIKSGGVARFEVKPA
ncbi:MAG: DUF4115 domain-containing protein, partial [Xenophilus sp.]